MNMLKRVFLVVLLTTGLSACAAVELAVEDRQSGDLGKDIKIKAAITSNVIEKMGSDFIKIDAEVYEQDVLLTGLVEGAAQRAQAQKITEEIEGVKRVYNEIQVVPKVNRKKGSVEGFVSDTVIEATIKARLIDAQGVNMTNFRWQSVQGKVVLFGRALSDAEKRKAGEIVKNVKGVVSVKNLAKVRPKG